MSSVDFDKSELQLLRAGAPGDGMPAVMRVGASNIYNVLVDKIRAGPVEVEIENTNSEEALVVDLAERPATDLRSILNLLSAMNRIEDVAKTENFICHDFATTRLALIRFYTAYS